MLSGRLQFGCNRAAVTLGYEQSAKSRVIFQLKCRSSGRVSGRASHWHYAPVALLPAIGASHLSNCSNRLQRTSDAVHNDMRSYIGRRSKHPAGGAERASCGRSMYGSFNSHSTARRSSHSSFRSNCRRFASHQSASQGLPASADAVFNKISTKGIISGIPKISSSTSSIAMPCHFHRCTSRILQLCQSGGLHNAVSSGIGYGRSNTGSSSAYCIGGSLRRCRPYRIGSQSVQSRASLGLTNTITSGISSALTVVDAYAPYLPALLASVGSVRLPSFHSIAASLHSSFKSGVMGASASASWQLLLVCLAVGWLLDRGTLPPETASVLSKVSFNLLIPCMLFTKVASTLAASQACTLFAIPLAATLQIALGWLLSRAAVAMVHGSYSPHFRLFGWHPRDPSSETTAIASAAAAAGRSPLAARALQPPEPPIPQGTLEMVTAACMFGNSMTLPLVFLSSLLPPVVSARAVGFLALYQMAWSPLLWSLGPRVLRPSESVDNDGLTSPTLMASLRGMPAAFRRHLTRVGPRGVLYYACASTWQLITSGSAAVWKGINPPLMGVSLGLIVGLSPAGPLLFPSATSTTHNFSAKLPAGLGWERAALLGGLRAAMDLLTTLGEATLAVSAIVLGASLFPPAKNGGNSSGGSGIESSEAVRPSGLHTIQMMLSRGPPGSRPSYNEKPIRQAGSFRRRVQRSFRLGLSRIDARALAAVAIVRLLLMPAASILLVKGLISIEWMAADPVIALVVLLQGSMPTAQNLVVLLHLDTKTERGAARLAEMLLRLYALAVIPLTLWVTVFVSILPGPLPC